jgi:hypothetical protein
MIPIKFHIIWPSGFRGKAVLEIDQSETKGERQAQLTELLVLFANMMCIMVKIFIF